MQRQFSRLKERFELLIFETEFWFYSEIQIKEENIKADDPVDFQFIGIPCLPV